ncbi:MAG: phosphoglycerate kinase [Gemmatimonadetes bacterium]|nr:MAG: phosphoglycerate kinase [Gemmatimonadota bacterium]
MPRLEDLPLARGRRVLVRVDLNVPLEDGAVADDLRITTALPTLEWLRENDAAVVVAGHLGRPKGAPDPEYSMAPVAARLSELLGQAVPLAPHVVGAAVDSYVASLEPGDLLMLENLRFERGETEDDPAFSTNLSELADDYVNEAFGASHRAHASIVGPPRLLPSAGGRLLFREVETLSRLLEAEEHPFVAVLGGAEISGKIDVIRSLLPRVDELLIGGAMACTFFRAMGLEVGDSLVEADRIELAKDLLATSGKKLILPRGGDIAPSLERASEHRSVAVDAIPKGWAVYDIDAATQHDYRARLLRAKTIFWNGPMGVFETPPFDAGTRAIATALVEAGKKGAVTVVGGGDSVAAVAGLEDQLTHVSTGGGASLEFLEGKELPGVAALEDK